MKMQGERAQSIVAGRARQTTSRSSSLFEDPAWEERFDRLIRLVHRTALIIELTGTDIKENRLKSVIDSRLAEMGMQAIRPRGVQPTCGARSFLSARQDRYDATYLMALHFGNRFTDEMSQVDTNLGRALDHALEVYAKYQRDCYPGGQIPRLSFESFVVLIRGIKSHEIGVRTCGECSARYPVPVHRLGIEYCPVCAVQDLKIRDARRVLDARIEAARRERRTAMGLDKPPAQRA